MSTIALNNQNVYVTIKLEKGRKENVCMGKNRSIYYGKCRCIRSICLYFRRKNLCPRSQIGWGISKWKNKKINDSRNNFNKCSAVFLWKNHQNLFLLVLTF